MQKKFRVVHYINQFFAQIGGEEAAEASLQRREGAVGPGMAFQAALGSDYEIIATLICGDNCFADKKEMVLKQIIAELKELKPDLVLAGPAFNAGRYGPSCGAVCKAVQESLHIPAINGMYEENPGVEMYRKDCYILKTQDSARGMREAVSAMSALAKKLLESKEELDPKTDKYFSKGFKKNVFTDKNGAERAVEMLLAKIAERPFETEIRMPVYETVPPAPPVSDLKKAKIALVTDAGVTDKENTYHLESARASKFLSLDLKGLQELSSENFRSVHGGFDTSIANQNPNVLVPLDLMRDLEQKEEIGSLHEILYSTTGNGTSLKNSKQFGEAIAKELKKYKVDAVILTST